MKRVAISQRVEHITSHGEDRDCLDQRWSQLASALDFILLPMPNLPAEQAQPYLSELGADAYILSGGNSIAALEPEANDASPLRDAFEATVLEYAISQEQPVLGVCRGMQMINVHLGGSLERVEGHVASRHALANSDSEYDFPDEVNSYHQWGIQPSSLAANLSPLATDKSGHIEAFVHTQHRILGIMWHPERQSPFNARDLQTIRRFVQ